MSLQLKLAVQSDSIKVLTKCINGWSSLVGLKVQSQVGQQIHVPIAGHCVVVGHYFDRLLHLSRFGMELHTISQHHHLHHQLFFVRPAKLFLLS